MENAIELENRIDMSAPWVEHYRKIEALFEYDPDVTVKYNDKERTVRLYVKGRDKAAALNTLLPSEIAFGNVTLDIAVIIDIEKLSLAQTFNRALLGNPLFSQAYEIRPDGASNAFSYVMFEPEVVQYWNDNLGDPHGIVSVLPQDLAKDIFEDGLGALYSTEKVD